MRYNALNIKEVNIRGTWTVNVFKLIASLIVCQFAGFIGSLFTTPSIPTWYAHINKPPFTPPNWLFGPVWLLLYLLMGIALFLAWHKGQKIPHARKALIFFGAQLVLNVLWSVVFFGFRSPLGGLIVICLLWIAIFMTIRNFYKISLTAARLLVPYILWVSFAAILNFSIFMLNRS